MFYTSFTERFFSSNKEIILTAKNNLGSIKNIFYKKIF